MKKTLVLGTLLLLAASSLCAQSMTITSPKQLSGVQLAFLGCETFPDPADMKRCMNAIGMDSAATVAIPISESGMPIPAAAQTTPAPTPGPVAGCAQANIGVDFIHFSNGQTGTMEEVAHPFTDCKKKVIGSLGFAMIQVPPAKTSFYLIGPRGDLPLANSFSKLDPAFKTVTLFAGCGIGTAQVSPDNAPQTNHFAYGCQSGISASPGSIFGVSTQFEIKGGVVGYSGHTFTATSLPNAAGQVSAAVLFNLGKK